MEQLIKKIAENMIKTRPQKQVVLRPYQKHDAITRHPLGTVEVDLNRLFPDAPEQSVVKVKTVLKVPYPNAAILGVWGAEAYLNGIRLMPDQEGYVQIDLAGDDELVFVCKKQNENFGVQFVLSTVHYRGMWASDYLYWIRYTLPEYPGEEGVAVTCLDGEKFIFPPAPVRVCLAELFPEKKYVFAVSYALCDTEYSGKQEMFVDGKPYQGGIIRQGSRVLLRLFPESDWEDFLETKDFGIPMLETKRNSGTQWMFLGSDNKELPETDFPKSCQNGFWRLLDGSYIRPYLDTSFFGKWFYALMVGQYGILKASVFLGASYKQYFIDGMNVLADYFFYMQREYAFFGSPSFLERSVMLTELDPIGTIGMNLCDLYQENHSENAKNVILALLDAMEHRVLHFPDGTFRRSETMWADDTFMSLPFLARVGEVFEDSSYFEQCIRQMKGFYQRLYWKEKKLFSHIYFIQDQKPNKVAWGRGNGWVFLTLSELLERIPTDFPERNWLVDIFSEFAEGICAHQAQDGLWHQVLDMPESYEETSCSGMFAIGLLRGVKNGWISSEYWENAERAVTAVAKNCVDSEGNILGVCKGSGCSYEKEYYAKLDTVTNDDHGTGIILAMLAEYLSGKKKEE